MFLSRFEKERSKLISDWKSLERNSKKIFFSDKLKLKTEENNSLTNILNVL